MGRTTVRDDNSILAGHDNVTAATTPSIIITFPTWDNRHRNVCLTTALIGSSSTATTLTIIGPSASSPAATTTIDYPVDGTLNPDLRTHIDHRRADNHDW
ncbi:hypothetical protein DL766_007392 [Monosporascus sp. MC13-8B]|uniref:Uncharacterized protein n=1 Tax=Monosporascus cannonballus TaxID=155416 RepID=A0ABY0HCS7_9PEZI|nr:hypothetical protein DL762_002653 [Monosporascus cannonballus]RYP23994.1 hypothetical protein DL766_007392 [Monosporascus sp. MC13-8B]